MRASSSSLLASFLIASIGAAIAACSGQTVTDNSKPGGNGGAGGSGGATSTTSAVSTSTTSTSSGGGAGGGGVCEQACAKAAQCQKPICTLLRIDCSDPKWDCAAKCILDTKTCNDLDLGNAMLTSCVQACQGGQGGAGGGGATGQACALCAQQQNCLTTCVNDTTCQAWLQCTQGCLLNDPHPQCLRNCDTQHPEAKADFDAAYSCVCSKCDTQCAAITGNCTPGTGGAGGH